MNWHQGDIFRIFPGHPLHFYSEKWHELLKFSVFAKKPTLLAMELLRPQHQRSVFTFSSLVALLALLASIMFIISTFFRFHVIHFCKFDCFTCYCGKTISLWTKCTLWGCKMITLAFWPQKTTFWNLDWVLGWGDIGTNNSYFWFHKRIYVKTNHVFQM